MIQLAIVFKMVWDYLLRSSDPFSGAHKANLRFMFYAKFYEWNEKHFLFRIYINKIILSFRRSSSSVGYNQRRNIPFQFYFIYKKKIDLMVQPEVASNKREMALLILQNFMSGLIILMIYINYNNIQ